VLRRNLRGEGVLVVANREPYIHERSEDGRVHVVHPASGLVTALEPDPRGSGGIRVHVDGVSFAMVAVEDVRNLSLAVGSPLAAEMMARLERRAEVFSGRMAALRILSYRALPSHEICRRLVRKGHAPAAAQEAVGALVTAGLINDEEFARHFARTRARRLPAACS
jgi:hypothetical protein